MDIITFIDKYLYFNNKKLDIHCHPSQKEYIQDNHKIIVACCGRKWGKSLAQAIKTLYFACSHPKSQQFIIAPSIDQTTIIFDYILELLTSSPIYPLLKKQVYRPWPELILKTGASIQGRTAYNPDALRGHKADRIVCDEAAFLDAYLIEQILRPMLIISGGSLELISTPWGHNTFYEYWLRGMDKLNYPLYNSHHFPSSLSPFISKEELEEERRNSSRLKWLVEYEAEFLEEEGAVFSWDDIQKCYLQFQHEYGDSFPLKPDNKSEHITGVDIAGFGDDNAVISTVRIKNDCLILCDIVILDKCSPSNLKRRIKLEQKKWNSKVIIDSHTLGESFVEDLQCEGYPVSSSKAKYELIQSLCRYIENGNFLFPYNEQIINELRFFEYTVSDKGIIKMEARRGHDDIVISFALAAWLHKESCLGLYFDDLSLDDSLDDEPQRRFCCNKPMEVRFISQESDEIYYHCRVCGTEQDKAGKAYERV